MFSYRRFKQFIIAVVGIWVLANVAHSRVLTIGANPIDGKQRAEFYKQVEAFKKQHPEVQVKLKSFQHESFKKHVERRIGEAKPLADVLFWFGGASLRHYASQGWLHNLTSIWDEEGWDKEFPRASKQTVSLYGMQYGLPLYYYHWGVYYRRSVFEALDLSPPKDWGSLLEVSRVLNEADIAPFTLAAKDNWPALSWFDYVDLRLNGLEFHESLLNGCVPFTDAKVLNVLDYLSILRDKDILREDISELDYKQAIKEFTSKQSAMILMGNFFLASIPNRIRTDIGFVPFPKIDPTLASYEDAPTDVLVVPANSENKEAAKLFLKFMASPKPQEELAKAMDIIPVNRDADLANDEHIQNGAYLLSNAVGLAQFFDRDSHPDFVEKAQVIISEFIAQPTSSYAVAQKLEAIRKEVWSDKGSNCR